MSKELRICPGVGARKCSAFLARLDRDPHPTCARCRGRICTKDMTCDFCAVWSAEQWELFAKKRSYKERKHRPSGSVPPAQQSSPCAETSSGVSRPGTSSSSSSRPLGGQGKQEGSQGAPGVVLGGAPSPPARPRSSERGGSASGHSSGVGGLAPSSRSPSGGGGAGVARVSESMDSPQFSLHVPRRENSRESSASCSRALSSHDSRSSWHEPRKDKRARSREGSCRGRRRRSRSRSSSRSRSRGRERGLHYLDDWLVLSSSEKKAKESIRELLSLCRTLGIVKNEKKSDLVPSQSVKYLGMTIDTGAGKVFPSLARVEKFLTVAERFCSMQSPLAQLWQVILGHLSSLERLVPHGRLRMRSLQWHLKMHWSPESDPPSLPVALLEEARRDLSWWMVRDHLLVGVRFGTPAPDLHLYSDASLSGWGAHLLDQNVSGVWSDQEKLLHISLLEMKALFLGLQAFQEDVAGHHVTAMCDNSTVVAYVNKQGGTVSRSLCLLTSRLLRWTESFDVHLDARYLPGESNVLADVLSRRGQVVGTEWSLHPQVARALLRAWGNPSIDLFATCLNAKLPLYCSLVPDPQAVFEDAFRHPWDDLDLYAFPPFPLVGRVIARVQESSRVAMTLVAPLWPEKEWFADLLLRQPHCSLFHQGVHALNLHAWRLSSRRASRVLSGVLRESSS